MRFLFTPLCVAVALLCLLLPLSVKAAGCPLPGQWFTPAGERLDTAGLMSELAERDVVLLGEQHDRMAHHRWQLHVIAGLHAQRPDMVIGLEMLPRKAQPVLDAWVAGELDEAAFLEASEWHDAWGFDPALYLPILHFARLHRVPLKAINVTPELRGRLVEEGWEGVPAGERHGISAPAEALPDYRQRLMEVHAEHRTAAVETSVDGTPDSSLERFIAAQLVWDRAMAAGLVNAADRGELVVGLIGQGHLQFGHGVPYQLDDLGMGDHVTLLPWTMDDKACELPPEGLAQALFALGEVPEPVSSPLQLGVYLLLQEQGVTVHAVMEDSVAEAAGLEEGDVIRRAAGEPVTRPGDLIQRVKRQPPGTLLPLEIRRDGKQHEVLARFPP